MKKVSEFFGCFLPIVVALGCQLLVTAGSLVFYGNVLNESAAYASAVLVITAIATAVTLVIGAVWYRGYRPETDFDFKGTVRLPLIVVMLCMGLLLQMWVSVLLNAVYPMLPQAITEEYSELMETLVGGNVWLSLLVTVVLAPLAEEFLFRGVTLKKAESVMPFMAANALQAFLFGVYHLNWIQGTYAFVLGLILGYVAKEFRSVWAAIFLHAFVNASGELLHYLPEHLTKNYEGIEFLILTSTVLCGITASLYQEAKGESERKPKV